jgi:hypothetical protein
MDEFIHYNFASTIFGVFGVVSYTSTFTSLV